MKTATTILATLAALLIAGSVPAAAQLVVGGEVPDGVVVNWSVLERLGPTPNLATLLQDPATARSAGKRIVYRPYAPAKPAAHVAKPARLVKPVTPKAATARPTASDRVKPVSVPAAPDKPVRSTALPPPRAELVEPLPPVAKPAPVAAAKPVDVPKPVEVAKPVETPKPIEAPKPVEVAKPIEAPKPVEPPKGPQISLPEVPKVTPPSPPPAKPVEIARIEPPAPPLPPPLALPVAVPAPAPPPPVVVPAKPVSLPASTPGAVIKKGDSLSVVFPADTSRLPDPAWNDLGALAQRMIKDESLSLQLLAYADGDDAATSKARRLSLSRALAVRTFLMDQGVRSTRIEVRALGNKIEGDGPRDRVDLVLAAH